MQQIISELNQIISEYSQKFAHIPDEDFDAKPNPENWSKKEIVGHLIDSAQNNLRRFIVGQYFQNDKIIYNQEFWNSINGYQHDSKGNVITLWILLNNRIAAVLKNIPADTYENTIDTGQEYTSLKTLNWLAEDYVKHMKHHINYIFPGSFEISY